jgi:hypothetical protein
VEPFRSHRTGREPDGSLSPRVSAGTRGLPHVCADPSTPVTSGVCNRIERVVVRVHDPRLRRHLLRDLAGVVGGWQAGADIQELPDPLLPGQVNALISGRRRKESADCLRDSGHVRARSGGCPADLGYQVPE